MVQGMVNRRKLSPLEEESWNKIMGILETKVSPTTFNPWMLSLSPLDILGEDVEGNKFRLTSDQAFGIQVLQKRYLSDISDAIFEVTGKRYAIELLQVQPNVKKTKPTKEKPDENVVQMRKQIEQMKQMHSFCGLNLNYTFENFVVGENSKFAYNAAVQISEAPGQKYNPLFINGSIGIGKTHIMQAIGHNILKHFPEMKVKYVKAENIMNQLVESLSSVKDTTYMMKKFRDTYRNVDVLLIDDIQFVEGKKRTEEEIFNIFDTLFHAGKQIVFASDRPIQEFTKTSDRLKSRYEWGLNVQITVPDYETRVEILKKYGARTNYLLEEDVIKFLASTFDNNVRELEGAYNKLSAYASICGENIDVQKAREILKCDMNLKTVTAKDIIAVCAKYFKVSIKDIEGTQRTKNISLARQVAIYLSREITENSFPELAKDFKKNHTTILYCYEKIAKAMKSDKELSLLINDVKNIIAKEK